MEALILIIAGITNVACFLIGAKVGQTVIKGEKIVTPTLNPIKIVKRHHDERESEAEQKRIDTIMRNIESYDGTGRGQEDVPR